jgi:hypothetical protein
LWQRRRGNLLKYGSLENKKNATKGGCAFLVWKKNLENLVQKTAKIVSKKPRKSCPKNRENLFQKTAKIFSKKPRKSCPKKREPSADIDIDVTILVCPEASL